MRLIIHLTQEITRTSNRLRAILTRYYPAALHVCHDPASQIALHFVQVVPTPQAAAQLSRADFAAFVRACQDRQSDLVFTKAFIRLQHPPRMRAEAVFRPRYWRAPINRKWVLAKRVRRPRQTPLHRNTHRSAEMVRFSPAGVTCSTAHVSFTTYSCLPLRTNTVGYDR